MNDTASYFGDPVMTQDQIAILVDEIYEKFGELGMLVVIVLGVGCCGVMVLWCYGAGCWVLGGTPLSLTSTLTNRRLQPPRHAPRDCEPSPLPPPDSSPTRP